MNNSENNPNTNQATEPVGRVQDQLQAPTQAPQPIRPHSPSMAPSQATAQAHTPTPRYVKSPAPPVQVRMQTPTEASFAREALVAPEVSIAHGGPVDDHASLHFLSSARGEQEFNAAQRHSGMVRRLRIVLPVLGVVVIIGFAGVLLLRTIGFEDISIGDVGIEKGKLVMANPQLTGTDSEQRPYSMKAARAFQDVKNPSNVSLETIDAFLQISSDNSARLTAGSGFYNTDSQKLTLGDNVKLETEDGTSLATKQADIDIPKGELKTEFPVEIISPQASISADTLRVENKGEKIIFENRVSLTINPGAFDRGENEATASTGN